MRIADLAQAGEYLVCEPSIDTLEMMTTVIIECVPEFSCSARTGPVREQLAVGKVTLWIDAVVVFDEAFASFASIDTSFVSKQATPRGINNCNTGAKHVET